MFPFGFSGHIEIWLDNVEDVNTRVARVAIAVAEEGGRITDRSPGKVAFDGPTLLRPYLTNFMFLRSRLALVSHATVSVAAGAPGDVRYTCWLSVLLAAATTLSLAAGAMGLLTGAGWLTVLAMAVGAWLWFYLPLYLIARARVASLIRESI